MPSIEDLNPEEFPLKPFGDRLFILPDPVPDERTTAGGLVMMTPTGQKAITGTIVAMGPTTREYADWLFVGQRVVYSEFAGYTVTYKNKTYLLCTPDDIFCGVPSHVHLS